MSEQIEPHILEQYQVIKKIGSGAYGHVWKVIDKHTKITKALKKNFDAFSNSTDAQRTYRQIMFLRQLKHPTIVNLQRTIRAKNDRDIYLIFEHMDVDLHTLIRQNGKSTNLEERHKKYIVYQIAKAIYYLHCSNLIHRDLKPSNVLINESCEAKLCDFGLVRFMEEPDDKQLVVMTDYIATRWYRAPELLLGCKDYSKEVDIWALGCLIGQLFCGKAMFPGTSTINQLEKVVAWTGAPTTAEVKQLAISQNSSITQLLNCRKKINRNDFFQNKIPSSCLDLISKMLEFDSSKRLTIEQVLRHEYLSQFFQQQEMKQIYNSRAKIQLHINDNRKLSLKDYRELIYFQINNRNNKILGNAMQNNYANYHDVHKTHEKSKNTKNDESRVKKQNTKEKSKLKTAPTAEFTESTYTTKNYTVYQSTEQKEENNGKFVRKDAKSSLQKSVKSKGQVRKKGISLCSKSMSKNTSLNKRKPEFQTAQNRQLNSRELIRKIKPYSRSCNQKYDKAKKILTQQSKPSKRVLLSNCYINQNIGRKMANQECK